ncbi:MAG: response regulator [Alphaproteobacteria bacterium]|nr:response regulator [Alphaproteobacteria bacterium]
MLRDTNRAVLIVEDEPFIRMAAADIVADLGVTPYEAADAGEALALLGARPDIDLLFTDVNMPGMDGVTLARRARELRPDVKLLVTSGRGAVPDGVLPEDGTFLPKPYGSRQLSSAVERTLAATRRH